MLEVLWIALAYVLGSVPWGLVIAKTFCHLDPRESGSRNTGATNVARLCGFGWGVATLACDVCKGAVPVWLAFRINPSPVFVSIVGLACVLGHVFSCFMKFRGGKAVATSIGVFLPLALWQLLAASVLCLLVIWRSGFGIMNLMEVENVNQDKWNEYIAKNTECETWHDFGKVAMIDWMKNKLEEVKKSKN